MYRDPRVFIACAVIAVPVLILWARGMPVMTFGALINLFLMPTVFAAAGEAGGDFEMDAAGIRGGEAHDRLTWPYIDRIELADVRWWYASTKVMGRYENLITIPARAFVPGSTIHPAELVRREAAARGIAIVGHQPVATPWQRFRAPLALLAINVVAASLLPFQLLVPDAGG